MNQFLQKHQQTLQEFAKQNRLKYLALFGSHARGEETPKSDVDLLVDFEKPIGLLELIGIEHQLEDRLGKKVDLIPKDSLSKYVKPYIQDDLTVIYEKST